MFTTESLQQYPGLVKAFTGLPAEEWSCTGTSSPGLAQSRHGRLRAKRACMLTAASLGGCRLSIPGCAERLRGVGRGPATRLVRVLRQRALEVYR